MKRNVRPDRGVTILSGDIIMEFISVWIKERGREYGQLCDHKGRTEVSLIL